MDIKFKKIEGEGVESPLSSIKPKKFKLNRKTIIIGGVVLIVAYLVVKRLVGGPSPAQSAAGPIDDGYGSNTVDTAAQLDNASSIMQSNVDSTLSQFAATIQSQIDTNNADMLGYVTQNVNDLTAGVQTTLNDKTAAFTDSLAAQNEKFVGMEQANKETFAGITEQLTTISKAKNTAATSTIVQPKAAAYTPVKGKLSTGTYGNQKEAENVANKLRTDYGGTNIQVVNEGGRYRVLSTFADSNRAKAVSDRLTTRKLATKVYTNNGKKV